MMTKSTSNAFLQSREGGGGASHPMAPKYATAQTCGWFRVLYGDDAVSVLHVVRSSIDSHHPMMSFGGLWRTVQLSPARRRKRLHALCVADAA